MYLFECKITLQSTDGEVSNTDIAVAKKFKTLWTLLEDLGLEYDATEEEEIIVWCTDHLNEEEPDLEKLHPDANDGNTRIMRKVIEVEKKWSAGVSRDSRRRLFDNVRSARSYQLSSYTRSHWINWYDVANRFYNEKTKTRTEMKTPEEIRKVFHIMNDLDDEDKEKNGSNESKKKKTEKK